MERRTKDTSTYRKFLVIFYEINTCKQLLARIINVSAVICNNQNVMFREYIIHCRCQVWIQVEEANFEKQECFFKK